jgi:hypothetical protein
MSVFNFEPYFISLIYDRVIGSIKAITYFPLKYLVNLKTINKLKMNEIWLHLYFG